ncbi:outer membrane beta-barrel protein [Mucilaginibacter gilvus]|uniref:Outer membrane protein beta-barrel domain-containing protein n=1 Tax=Mucilaginibacter gilvus TaxID=2305909 RepID=A0A444MU60_9SPHI|nr:outer membrane beta-barrel protein [Mucilaginibacter gilvus]RWY57149.1 hypothetical protein EPL05_01035 [Mucilaginibacter gilvus]
MKKILLAILFVGSISATCLAQSDSDAAKFSIGVNLGLPTGVAHDISSFAPGIDVKYDLPISTGTFFTISAGYTRFLYNSDTKDALKSLGVDKSGAGFVPLKAGIKYYFSDGFYGEGQLGATFSTESGGGTAFAYAPGIGYTFAGGFDLGLRYEAWSKNGTTSQVAARIAISF